MSVFDGWLGKMNLFLLLLSYLLKWLLEMNTGGARVPQCLAQGRPCGKGPPQPPGLFPVLTEFGSGRGLTACLVLIVSLFWLGQGGERLGLLCQSKNVEKIIWRKWRRYRCSKLGWWKTDILLSFFSPLKKPARWVAAYRSVWLRLCETRPSPVPLLSSLCLPCPAWPWWGPDITYLVCQTPDMHSVT